MRFHDTVTEADLIETCSQAGEREGTVGPGR
jgi:hypothetical protein